jgi:glycosyltransferase involved in cell wall biosynthesis
MNIIQITPGAGGMYCGGCFRDNALVKAVRKQSHNATMVPLYLPLTLEEENQAAGVPIFFGGINVYLQQKSSLFRNAPQWLHNFLDSPQLLRWASGSAAKTRPEDAGALTISMLRGEEGNQTRELDELLSWLKKSERPDIISLSNVLLIGMVRRLKQELKVPVVCFLSGEDTFLDGLPVAFRAEAWQVVTRRAKEVDLFLAPSEYYAGLMRQRLELPPEQVKVLHNGINLEGYFPPPKPVSPPVLGYFARISREKGADLLVKSFILLKERNRVPNLRLHIGGGLSPLDEQTVLNPLKVDLRQRKLLDDVRFFPNLNRTGKQDFLRTLSIFSVPALYGEAFGLYLLEAMASGVPVVQPNHAAFPEIIQATGGGRIVEANAQSLAEGIEDFLLNPEALHRASEEGRRAVQEKFSIETMSIRFLETCDQLLEQESLS